MWHVFRVPVVLRSIAVNQDVVKTTSVGSTKVRLWPSCREMLKGVEFS